MQRRVDNGIRFSFYRNPRAPAAWPLYRLKLVLTSYIRFEPIMTGFNGSYMVTTSGGFAYKRRPFSRITALLRRRPQQQRQQGRSESMSKL